MEEIQDIRFRTLDIRLKTLDSRYSTPEMAWERRPGNADLGAQASLPAIRNGLGTQASLPAIQSAFSSSYVSATHDNYSGNGLGAQTWERRHPCLQFSTYFHHRV